MSLIESPSTRRRPDLATDRAPAGSKTTTAVAVWATIGGLWLAFIVFIWAKWITGPFFERVPAGPSEQPGWMSTLQTIWEPAFAVIALGFLYWFLVKPWRRDGQPSTDGLLCAA